MERSEEVLVKQIDGGGISLNYSGLEASGRIDILSLLKAEVEVAGS